MLRQLFDSGLNVTADVEPRNQPHAPDLVLLLLLLLL
jgi:hypothetical protein